ncbi:restriction endonuclease subunit S [Geobacillus thermoleovorans]|uniref:restriction endonuclease subunit S n=1 Tax=Geobacillus thermoleovorans TaxID=33941 RepID=UPI001680DC1A|nr:restriction endonuclease subunit S [Geobacillus thermoleovorans]QNU23127.1 restriction endonuclease subunit S [Geobacillus thermoleovorans]
MRKVSLGSLVNIRTGKLDANASDPEGKYPFFTCSRETLKIDTYSYDCECVLVAGNGDLNVKYYNGKFDAYQRTYIIESIDKNILNVKYLYYFMQLYVSKLRQMSIGGVIKYIKLNYLTDAKIPLPNIEKQNKIVKVLEKAQELIDKRKAQIKALDQLTKSLFLEMFGDLKNNRYNWPIAELGDVCISIKDGPHVSPKYTQKGIPFISVNNIINNKWDFTNVKYISETDYEIFAKRCKPEKGDILYTKGGTTGFAKYIDIDIKFMNWVHLAVLKYDKNIMDGIFLTHMLNSHFCYAQSQKYTRGIANRDLVLSQMKKIKVLVPPLERQKNLFQ